MSVLDVSTGCHRRFQTAPRPGVADRPTSGATPIGSDRPGAHPGAAGTTPPNAAIPIRSAKSVRAPHTTYIPHYSGRIIRKRLLHNNLRQYSVRTFIIGYWASLVARPVLATSC